MNDSLKFTTPGGKIVYGGGGIIPDVFVAGPNGYAQQTAGSSLINFLITRLLNISQSHRLINWWINDQCLYVYYDKIFPRLICHVLSFFVAPL